MKNKLRDLLLCVEMNKPNTHIFVSCMTDKWGFDSSSNVILSGIIVLILSSLPSGNSNNQTNGIITCINRLKVTNPILWAPMIIMGPLVVASRLGINYYMVWWMINK